VEIYVRLNFLTLFDTELRLVLLLFGSRLLHGNVVREGSYRLEFLFNLFSNNFLNFGLKGCS
jgi:hypothetical protein